MLRRSKERGMTPYDVIWILLVVACLLSIALSRFKNAQWRNRNIEAIKSLQDIAQAEQSFFFRPRLAADGALLPPCLLAAPFSPDENPTARTRPWVDPSGVFKKLAFTPSKPTFFSYGILSDSLDEIGICRQPQQKDLKVGDAKISIVALADFDSDETLSISEEKDLRGLLSPERPCDLQQIEELPCPLPSCKNLDSYFRLAIEATQLRKFSVGEIQVAENTSKSCEKH